MDPTFIPLNLTEVDYITATEYERKYDIFYWRNLSSEYWIVSVYLSAIYVILLFVGVIYMKPRQPFKNNGILAVWNIGLSVMSILAFSRSLPEFVHILSRENGFYNSICRWNEHTHATAFWCCVVSLSKAVELGDTVFVVLRKKKLSFLHCYHHVATLTSSWYLFYWYEPVQNWYVIMNSFVHSFMYTYYALWAMRIKIPKLIAMLITSVQLLQMFCAVYINFYAIWVMYIIGTPEDCPHRSWRGIAVATSIFVTFCLLFANFFINSYVVKGKGKSKEY